MKLSPFATLFLLLASSTAVAEPIVTSMGARIGGYGFRERRTEMDQSHSATGWQACRMNGIGVFANKDLNQSFFVQASIDTYFTDSFPTGEAMGNYDTPIDRASALLSVAGGARFLQSSRLSPYLQVGLGAELTRVRLPALSLEDKALLPLGFFGFGADVKVSDKLSVGAMLKVNAMGYYDDAQFQSNLSPEMELSSQGQFYATLEL